MDAPADDGVLAEIAERAHEAERQGEWERAAGGFRELFRFSARRGETRGMVDALRGGARIRREQGRFEEAEELADLSREIAERHGLPREAARAVNVLAILRHVQQDWTGARALYEEALEKALDVGDDELVGLSCQNLGVVANMRGDFREARVRYLECIGSAVRSGNKRNELMAYNNLGMVCADMGEWLEAEVYFSRGIEIADRISDHAQMSRLLSNRAEPLIGIGEVAKARDSLDQAEELAVRIGARDVIVDVARFRGMAARVDGDREAAERHLLTSRDGAAAWGADLERAEALRELAALYLEAGRAAEARAASVEAAAIYRELGAEHAAVRTEELLRVSAGA